MRSASHLLIEARGRAALSQSDLARRAGMPRSVLNAYERGRREPGAEALARLLDAAGFTLDLRSVGGRVADERAGRILSTVLELAESLPSPSSDTPVSARRSALGRRVRAVNEKLAAAVTPHAVGGGIALAYCGAESRVTRLLEVHVFVGSRRPTGCSPNCRQSAVSMSPRSTAA